MSVSSIVERQMTQYPEAEISALEIEVGLQSGVDIPSFQTAMESVIRTSPWPTARVEIIVIPARFQCLDCGGRFDIDHPDRSTTTLPVRNVAHAGRYQSRAATFGSAPSGLRPNRPTGSHIYHSKTLLPVKLRHPNNLETVSSLYSHNGKRINRQ